MFILGLYLVKNDVVVHRTKSSYDQCFVMHHTECNNVLLDMWEVIGGRRLA